MKISVVLPVYNSLGTLEKAVKSILNQTFEDFELLIINDGSTDGSTEMINTLSLKDPRIKVFHLRRMGIARALNFGLKMSSGKYIARMDADDFSHSDRLQVQFDYLEKHPEVGLVSCKVIFKGDKKISEGYALFVEWINCILTSQDILRKRFQESPFAHPSVFFRSSLPRKFGGYAEGNIPEDYELWLRWLHHGVVMEKTEQFLLEWHDNPSRLSRIHQHYHMDNFFKIKAHYLSLFLHQKFRDHIPELWIWGAGRTVNKKIKPLTDHGLRVSKHIDVKKHERTSSKFIHYLNIPDAGKVFILCYVSDRKGKEEILSFLLKKGYQEGSDYFMMA